MEIELRPYQREFIGNIQAKIDAGFSRICGVAPCGSGKTIMAGWLIREWLKSGKRAIFFVHRAELVEQTSETFTQLGIPHGIIAAAVANKNFSAVTF